MSHASVQALVCGQKVMRYGHILSSSLAKRLNKKVRLGYMVQKIFRVTIVLQFIIILSIHYLFE
jgi:hypothetical protein